MAIKIHHTNFWKIFDHTNFFVHKIIKNKLGIEYLDSTIDSSDILFCSVFGNKELLIQTVDNYKKTKVLISLENFNHPSHKWIKNHLNKFDFIFGLNDIKQDNYHRIPFYVVEYFNTNEKLIPINQDKTKQVCLIANNPQKLRLELLNRLKNKIPVDCPGRVGKNIPISIKQKDKIDFIKYYHFNICPENSHDTGYTTEKLFHALYSGSIPIYWGDLTIDSIFYNQNKILQIDKNQSNINQIIDKCIYLLEHKNEYKKIENLSPFRENYLDIIHKEIHKFSNILNSIV